MHSATPQAINFECEVKVGSQSSTFPRVNYRPVQQNSFYLRNVSHNLNHTKAYIHLSFLTISFEFYGGIKAYLASVVEPNLLVKLRRPVTTRQRVRNAGFTCCTVADTHGCGQRGGLHRILQPSACSFSV